MSFINKEGLIAESKDSLTSAQRRLDRYENLLIGHISGGKSLESDLSKMVQEAVAHYRREVENLRLVYLEALKQLEQAVDQINQPFPLPEVPQPVEEEEEEEEEEGPPQII
jgi:tetrahydromethanopterin S-methyltransferase subunit A